MECFTVLIFLFILIAVIEVSSSISDGNTLPLKLSTHPRKKIKRTKAAVSIIPIASQCMNLFYWVTLN